MFKKIILAAALVAGSVFAQTGVKVGAGAAFTMGTSWGENNDKLYTGWGPGFVAGFDVKVPINQSVSFVTGLGFEYRKIPTDFWKKGLFGVMAKAYNAYIDKIGDMYGVNVESERMSEAEIRASMEKNGSFEMVLNTDASFSLKYLDIPLIIRYNVNPQFFIDGGVLVGFNVSADMGLSYESMSRDMEVPSNSTSVVDIDVVAGMGFSIQPNFDVYFRFNFGVTDMVDFRKCLMSYFEKMEESAEMIEMISTGFESNYGFKNMRFQLGATYWFM